MAPQRRARGPLARDGAAGAHPSALPVQQHEHDRVADAQRPGARRGSDRGPLRPVPREPERSARLDHAARGDRDRADLPAHRAAAARRAAAGRLGRVDGLPLRALVPGLLLQPLLENAIGHGIEPLPEGGIVEIRGSARRQRLAIDVTNPKARRRPVGARRTRHGARQHPPAARARVSGPLVRRGRGPGHVRRSDCGSRAEAEFPAALAENATAAA